VALRDVGVDWVACGDSAKVVGLVVDVIIIILLGLGIAVMRALR